MVSNKKTKLLSIFFGAAFSLLTLSVQASSVALPSPNSSAQPIDSIAAVVNDEVITQNELNVALNRAKKTIAQKHMKAPSPATLRSIILNQVIYQKLQVQIAKRMKLKVTEKQITNAVNQITKQRHLTLDQLKEKLREDNYSFSEFRKQIGNQLLMAQVQKQAINSNLTVTDKQVSQLMQQFAMKAHGTKQYHVADILIPASDSAQKTAQAILQKLKNGADFNAVAAGYANVKSTNLGWTSPNNLPGLFLEKLQTMKSNSVSGIIKAPNGLHILKLYGARGKAARMPTKAQAQRLLMQQNFQKELQKWLVELRQSAYVKIMANG